MQRIQVHHVGGTAEERLQFGQVGELRQPRDVPVLAGVGLFKLRDRLGERRGELIEAADAVVGQQVRPDVTHHRPDLGDGVGDGCTRAQKDVAAEALAEAAGQARRPAYSRMWLVAAIADIRDEKAAKALAGLLDDKSSQVRNVVAYHGPKQHSDSLDKAILDRARADESGLFTSYALLGFMVFRETVQAELVKTGLDSPDARTRATATGALAGMASDFNKTRLRQMLNDKDARVREVAGRVLRAMGESTSQPASRPS